MAMADSRMKLQASLPVVSFDYAGLVAWAQGFVSKYNGLVVTEDQIPEIREVMAEINKAKINIDNARKETVKELSAPLKDFEGKIKQVNAIFDETYRFLGDQVQHFVEQEREAKRKLVLDIIADELASRQAEIEPFDIPVQDKWLNKSTSQKAVREAVLGIIDQRIESERLRRQAVQVRQERAAAIEQAVKAANSEHSINMPVHKFMDSLCTDPDTDFSAVCDHIKKAAESEVARLSAASTFSAVPQPAQKQPVETPASHEPAACALPTAESGPDKTMSIIISFSPANEGAVRQALAELKKHCTSYGARVR